MKKTKKAMIGLMLTMFSVVGSSAIGVLPETTIVAEAARFVNPQDELYRPVNSTYVLNTKCVGTSKLDLKKNESVYIKVPRGTKGTTFVQTKSLGVQYCGKTKDKKYDKYKVSLCSFNTSGKVIFQTKGTSRRYAIEVNRYYIK